jgi:hypothetical protein
MLLLCQQLENGFEYNLDEFFTKEVYPKLRAKMKRYHHPKTKSKA